MLGADVGRASLVPQHNPALPPKDEQKRGQEDEQEQESDEKQYQWEQ